MWSKLERPACWGFVLDSRQPFSDPGIGDLSGDSQRLLGADPALAHNLRRVLNLVGFYRVDGCGRGLKGLWVGAERFPPD
jgi:hypothetical protein